MTLATLSVKKHTRLEPIVCVTKISTLYQQHVITWLEKHCGSASYCLFWSPQKELKISFKNIPCYMAKKTPEDGPPSREKCPPRNVWKTSPWSNCATWQPLT